MIKTKFCDICNREFPPSVFPPYDCLDTELHMEHPWKNSSTVRITLHPQLTNGSQSYSPDVCPDCLVAMAEKLCAKLKARNRREMPRLLAITQAAVHLKSHVEHGPEPKRAGYSKFKA